MNQGELVTAHLTGQVTGEKPTFDRSKLAGIEVPQHQNRIAVERSWHWAEEATNVEVPSNTITCMYHKNQPKVGKYIYFNMHTWILWELMKAFHQATTRKGP